MFCPDMEDAAFFDCVISSRLCSFLSLWSVDTAPLACFVMMMVVAFCGMGEKCVV